MLAEPVTGAPFLGEDCGGVYGLEIKGGDALGLLVFGDGEVRGLEIADDGAGFFVADDHVGEDDVGACGEGVGGLGGGVLRGERAWARHAIRRMMREGECGFCIGCGSSREF